MCMIYSKFFSSIIQIQIKVQKPQKKPKVGEFIKRNDRYVSRNKKWRV